MPSIAIPVGLTHEDVFARLGASVWHRCLNSHEVCSGHGGLWAWFILEIAGLWYPAHVLIDGARREVRFHVHGGFTAASGQEAMLRWSYEDAKVGLRSARRMLSNDAADEAACRLHRICLAALHRIERLVDEYRIGSLRHMGT